MDDVATAKINYEESGLVVSGTIIFIITSLFIKARRDDLASMAGGSSDTRPGIVMASRHSTVPPVGNSRDRRIELPGRWQPVERVNVRL
jgi:hypothetical protein